MVRTVASTWIQWGSVFSIYWPQTLFSQILSNVGHFSRIQNQCCQIIYPWGGFVSMLQCLFQGTRNSGQHMKQDEVPKMELETGCCSWWMWRHSRTPITLGKNIREWEREASLQKSFNVCPSYQESRWSDCCPLWKPGATTGWAKWHFSGAWIGQPHNFRGGNLASLHQCKNIISGVGGHGFSYNH